MRTICNIRDLRGGLKQSLNGCIEDEETSDADHLFEVLGNYCFLNSSS